MNSCRKLGEFESNNSRNSEEIPAGYSEWFTGEIPEHVPAGIFEESYRAVSMQISDRLIVQISEEISGRFSK